MTHSNRRTFLQTAAVLLATAYTGSSFTEKKYTPRLSFTTLGCPDWTFQQIADFAAQHNYSGIELRGIQRELDLTKCKEFSNTQNIRATMQIMKEKGLRFINLGSSATLHFADTRERQKNIDEGKRFIDLAQQINCPYIRVFPNNFPKDQDRNQTIDLIAKGLVELASHATGSKVSILMETHGDLVKADDVLEIMQAAGHTQVAIIWDITNMWTITKESPAEVYSKLKKYIRHTHIKDAKLTEGKIQYTLLGRGEVPVFEAIDVLSKDGYKGFYSFEWEKLWHPELDEPDVALADYSKIIKQHFK